MADTTIVTTPRGTDRRIWAGLGVLLAATAAAYLCNLSASGYGNNFYAAAELAGSQDWKAFLFGSSDAANSVTVDKTPLSLWPSGLAVRIFGLSSWSVLAPYILVGVAAVALLWFTVRRYAGTTAAFLAGIVLATTPVAVLMFRYNNPDAMLLLLMVAAVWAVLRACEDGRWRWAVWAGIFVGLGFLAKQLQVFLVVPALVLVFLIASPRNWKVRIGQLAAALGAMVVSAGWYLLLVELWPADSRPYIGGSQNNSILELTLGYNGLGRINGEETGAVTGGGGNAGGGMWGDTGLLRMFQPSQAGQIAWLIPAALILLVAVLVLVRRRPRTDMLRASVIVWGTWLIVTGLVFSFMKGIFHQYYTVALAPAVAALVGIGLATLWQRRDARWTTWVLAVVVAVTTVWSVVLLGRSEDFVAWLRIVVAASGAVALLALLVMAFGFSRRSVVAVVVTTGSVAMLGGPVAYAVDTIGTAHTGAIVTAGPEVAGATGPGSHMGRAGGPGGGVAGGMAGGPGGSGPTGGSGRQSQIPGQGIPGAPGTAGAPGGTSGEAGGMTGGGARGGGLNGGTAEAGVVDLLTADADDYTWAGAAVGSQTAAAYQLASEKPVMPIGGYNGSDPTPTLEAFKQYVAEGKIHWFIGGGSSRGGNQMGGSSVSAEITSWIEENFTATTVGSATVYDLTAPTSTTGGTAASTTAP